MGRVTSLIVLEKDRTLLEDYVSKIELIKGVDSLTRLVCDSVDSLLRRQSDLPFAESIKDEYLTRIINISFRAQKEFAVETITTVIGIRPEIAAAWLEWKRTNNLSDLAAWNGNEHRHFKVKAHEKPAPSSLRQGQPSEAEAALIAHVQKMVETKFGLFKSKPQPIPSMAYCQIEGFFLAHSSVQSLLVKLVTDGIMVLCANTLLKDVLKPMQDAGADPEKFFQSKNALIAKIIAGQMNAVNQTLHTRSQLDALGPQFKVVKKQPAKPKKRSLFGVSLSMGKESPAKQVKVQIDRDSVLTLEDREAIALKTMFDELVADLPISVPVEFNLSFVQAFLELDSGMFEKWVKEITSLVGNSKTTKAFLDERLKQLKQQLKPAMTEALTLKLFFSNPERGFRIDQLYGLCLMESEMIGIYGEIYPFIRTELMRRPKELAIQFRESVKTRQSINNVETCLTQILALRNMLSAEFDDSFAEAAMLLSEFKLVLSRDPCAEMIAQMGALAAAALGAKTQAREDAVKKAVQIYTKVLKGA